MLTSDSKAASLSARATTKRAAYMANASSSVQSSNKALSGGRHHVGNTAAHAAPNRVHARKMSQALCSPGTHITSLHTTVFRHAELQLVAVAPLQPDCHASPTRPLPRLPPPAHTPFPPSPEYLHNSVVSRGDSDGGLAKSSVGLKPRRTCVLRNVGHCNSRESGQAPTF